MIILGVCLLLASHRVPVHTILKANISNGNGEGRPESTDRGARYTAALRLQAHVCNPAIVRVTKTMHR